VVAAGPERRFALDADIQERAAMGRLNRIRGQSSFDFLPAGSGVDRMAVGVSTISSTNLFWLTVN
jgi:hypothetical protein